MLRTIIPLFYKKVIMHNIIRLLMVKYDIHCIQVREYSLVFRKVVDI